MFRRKEQQELAYKSGRVSASANTLVQIQAANLFVSYAARRCKTSVTEFTSSHHYVLGYIDYLTEKRENAGRYTSV